MDAHAFLILLLASLPLIKVFGDSRWIYLLYAGWLLLFISFDPDGTAMKFDLSLTEWTFALLLVLGLRYRRIFGLAADLGWGHWAVLFLFYALSAWIDTVVLRVFERVEASGSILGESLYLLLGMVIVGFLPLGLFWAYQRLPIPTRTKTT